MTTHNTKTTRQSQPNPWYKEFWAWFIFTPLVAIVGVMSVLIYFAYSAKDDVVTDNYQKKGRMLEASFEAQSFAKELGLMGILTSIEDNTYLILGSIQTVFAPSISLYIEHPFKQGLDTTVIFEQIATDQMDNSVFAKSLDQLKQQANLQHHYFYQLKDNGVLTGKRYLKASYYTPSTVASDKLEVWRLSGETHFDKSSFTFLTP